MNQLDLDDRYGRKRSPLRFVGYLIFAALIGWLLWTAAYHSKPTVVSNLLSFNLVDEKRMQIKFEITRSDPNQIIECRLAAVDFDKFVVGEIAYRIPAGNKHEVLTTEIPTRVRSVSASVVGCKAAN